MNNSDNFLKTYSDYLDETGEHLTLAGISIFLNFPQNLTEKEKSFIHKHLDECPECKSQFNEIFDNELEFDERTEKQVLNKSTFNLASPDTSHQLLFSSGEGERELVVNFKREGSESYILTIGKLPIRFRSSHIKLTFQHHSNIVRIINATEGNEIRFEPGRDFNPEKINNIETSAIPTEMQDRKGDRKIQKGGQYWYLKYAAVAAILILITTFTIIYFKGRVPQGRDFVASVDFSGENFQENPLLENFIDRKIRSESTIEIIKPRNSDTLLSTVNFSWNATDENNQYQILILNNKNQVVWEKKTPQSSLDFSEKLDSGLYYWKLEADEKLVYVGKFFYIRE